MADRPPRWLAAAAVAAAALATGVGSLATGGGVTNDSYHYVDLARTLRAEHRYRHHTPGYNAPTFPDRVVASAPETAQPPGFSLAVAAALALGLDGLPAAWFVAALGGALAVATGALLAWRLAGPEGALLAAALLASCPALRTAAGTAWSDGLGTALWLAAAAAIATARSSRGALSAAVAGAVAGAAFGVRYALWPALALGAATLLLPGRGHRHRLASVLAFAAGAIPLPALLVIRNLRLGSGPLGPPRLPAEEPLLAVLRQAATALLRDGGMAAWWPAALAGAAAVAALSGRLGDRRRCGAALPPALWGLAYLGATATARCLRHFDPLDGRLLLPAIAAAAVAVAVAATAARRPGPSGLRTLALAVIAVGAAVSPWPRAATPRTALEPGARRVAAILPERALVLGEDTVDLTYLTGRTTYSFSPYPYSLPPDPQRVLRLARAVARRGGDLYLLLRWPPRRPTPELTRRYGQWIAAVYAGRAKPPPELRLVLRWGGVALFRIAPDPSSAPRTRPSGSPRGPAPTSPFSGEVRGTSPGRERAPGRATP